MNKRTFALVAVVLATILTLTACNSSSSPTATGATSPSMMMPTTSSPSSAGATARNNSDIAFALDMTSHHQQAVAMAQLATTRGSDPRVKDLATRIEVAQGLEITMMSGWLINWNAPTPASSTGMDGMSGMGDTTTMPGTMSDADMTALAASSGAPFDKAFLTMMITHHQSALTMASTELKSGSNVDARALAHSIIEGQTQEIAEMKAILKTG